MSMIMDLCLCYLIYLHIKCVYRKLICVCSCVFCVFVVLDIYCIVHVIVWQRLK
jgi:hypothetical protein